MHAYWGSRYVPVAYNSPRVWAKKALRRGQAVTTLDAWYNPGLDQALKDLVRSVTFDAVIVEYVFLSKAFESVSAPLKILDTHDVLSQRKAPGRYWWAALPAEEEKRGLDRAGVVVAISPEDAAALASLTQRLVVTVGHLVPVYPPAPGHASRKILFVGSENPLNLEGALFFVRDVLPLVCSALPGVELVVAGRVCNPLAAALGANPPCNITLLGEVADLTPVYQSAAVVVNPVLGGTGLPIKSIAALGYGKPLVATPAGARGLDGAGADSPVVVAATPRSFSDALVEILRSPDLAYQMGLQANALAGQLNRTAIQSLAEVLGLPTGAEV